MLLSGAHLVGSPSSSLSPFCCRNRGEQGHGLRPAAEPGPDPSNSPGRGACRHLCPREPRPACGLLELPWAQRCLWAECPPCSGVPSDPQPLRGPPEAALRSPSWLWQHLGARPAGAELGKMRGGQEAHQVLPKTKVQVKGKGRHPGFVSGRSEVPDLLPTPTTQGLITCLHPPHMRGPAAP